MRRIGRVSRWPYLAGQRKSQSLPVPIPASLQIRRRASPHPDQPTAPGARVTTALYCCPSGSTQVKGTPLPGCCWSSRSVSAVSDATDSPEDLLFGPAPARRRAVKSPRRRIARSSTSTPANVSAAWSRAHPAYSCAAATSNRSTAECATNASTSTASGPGPSQRRDRLIASGFDELVSKADWIRKDRLVASRHLDQPELSEPA